MENVILGFLFIVIVLAGAAVILKKLSTQEEVVDDLPYARKYSFFTKSEQVFFDLLHDRLPGDRFQVFPKVRMGDYIQPTNSGKERWGSWSRIKSRHVDFAIWDATAAKLVLAIELDGKSHSGHKAKEADDFKDELFATIGLPLHRVRVGSDFATEIEQVLQRSGIVTSND